MSCCRAGGWFCFFFQAEDGIRDDLVTGVQTCALPISSLIALARPPLAFAMGCFLAQQLFGDICFSVYNVHELTLRQSIAPERVLGRVNSVKIGRASCRERV